MPVAIAWPPCDKGAILSAQVFISYRRSDPLPARHLALLLETRLHCIPFLDQDRIKLGENYEVAIEKELGASSAIVVLIGQDWKSAVQVSDSFVRKEIITAQQKKIPILPVVLDGVSMPTVDELPEDLAFFSLCQAISVSESQFEHDVSPLMVSLEELIGRVVVNEMAEALRPLRLLADLVNYSPRFLSLVVRPRQVVHAFDSSRTEELVRASVFLTLSLLIYTLFSVPLFMGKSRMVTLLLVQFFMLGALAFCSSAVLQLSWLPVGGKAPFGRYLSVNLYYWGVSSVLGLILIVAALGVLKLFDPHLLELLHRAAGGDLHPLINAKPAKSIPFRAVAWMIGIGNFLLLIWTYKFWGAYQDINDSTRLRSFLAFCISCIAFLPVGVFFVLLQAGLLNYLAP